MGNLLKKTKLSRETEHRKFTGADQGCIHRILSGPVCLCVGSPCPLYIIHPLIRRSFDKACYANVIMILEGHGTSHIHNHLANSAGMGKSGPVKTGPTGVVDTPLQTYMLYLFGLGKGSFEILKVMQAIPPTGTLQLPVTNTINRCCSRIVKLSSTSQKPLHRVV